MEGKLFCKQMQLFLEYYKKTLLLAKKYKNQLYLVGDRGENLAASLCTVFDCFQKVCCALFFQGVYFLEDQEGTYGKFLLAFRECTRLHSQLMGIFADCKCEHTEPGSGRELLLMQVEYENQLLNDTVSLWETHKGNISEAEDVQSACNTMSEFMFTAHGIFFSALAGFGSDVYGALSAYRDNASYGHSRIIDSYYPQEEKVQQP